MTFRPLHCELISAIKVWVTNPAIAGHYRWLAIAAFRGAESRLVLSYTNDLSLKAAIDTVHNQLGKSWEMDESFYPTGRQCFDFGLREQQVEMEVAA